MAEQTKDFSQGVADAFTSAQQAGKFATEFASGAIQWMAGSTAEAIAEVSTQAETAAHQSVEQAAEIAGKVATPIIDNPLLQLISKAPGLGWIGSLGQADIAEAQSDVDRLKQQYKSENDEEIAHRIMVDTALKAAGVGLLAT
ncbi:MAG: hypothetical protein HC886_06030 [Leptolyngbyaceae cyanobacterium SM1_1_3]|nr:hypothetical protein [Leptolyngbyaceae cyanobacterium SM1_1_3]